MRSLKKLKFEINRREKMFCAWHPRASAELFKQNERLLKWRCKALQIWVLWVKQIDLLVD